MYTTTRDVEESIIENIKQIAAASLGIIAVTKVVQLWWCNNNNDDDKCSDYAPKHINIYMT